MASHIDARVGYHHPLDSKSCFKYTGFERTYFIAKGNIIEGIQATEENPQVNGAYNEGITPQVAQSIGQANQQLAELGSGLSSVKLARNSKGYTWEIKAYCEDIDKAKKKVEEINSDWIRQYGER